MKIQNKSTKNSLESKSIDYQLQPYTNPALIEENGPQVFNSGSGVKVKDIDGKSYFEGMSGLWCASLGFSENELIEAAIDQMKKLPFYHSFTGKTCESTINLSERLIQIAPNNLKKVFFCNSGSEANDTAIKIVWYFHASLGNPQKRKIISRKGSYHGVTLAAASLTGLDYAQKGFNLPLDFAIHTTWPHYFQNSNNDESEKDFCNRLVSDLEKLIESEGAQNIGAFIAEPLMGAGGVIVPPKDYFELIQPILKQNNILFIADEVICGFGRTGNMWGCETFSINPDILTCAKGLSSAYAPISAVLMSEKIAYEVEKQAINLGQFGHGFTYSGHPVSSAVALKTIEIMEERNIINHVREVSDLFFKRILKLQKYECVGHVRSIGLIGAAEFIKPGTKREKIDPKYKFAARVVKKIHEKGVILRALPIDAIAFCPPLIISKKEINEMFDKLESVFPEIDQIAKGFN
tara:strand:+ start:21 stop:1412 length:1392 start_codon:yes stop_codon:yes gene_type:complete